jgi:lysozyme
MRRVSQTLVDFLKKAEGCRLTAYQDVAGVWTIGYGHTKGVKAGDRITGYQAEQFLRDDLAEFENYVNSKVRNIRTQGQFDAVVDFCYNIGYGVKGFGGSTLKRKIESGAKTADIQREFLRWTWAGGKQSDGLFSRRIWEAARFLD